MSSKSARKRKDKPIPKAVARPREKMDGVSRGYDPNYVPARDGSRCPVCKGGVHGRDSLCDYHWKEYLGTHAGGRGPEDNDRDREAEDDFYKHEARRRQENR